MSLPVLQELSALGSVVGKVAFGDNKGALQVCHEYADESVLGSGAVALMLVLQGDAALAATYGKGCGRAFGRALAGGGLLANVPVFKELDKCGRSLGDVIGGCDLQSAQQRWTVEWVQEYHDPNLWAKGMVDVLMTGAVITVGVLSAGTASIGLAAAQGALIGSTSGLISNASHQVIDMTIESNRVDEDSGEKTIKRRNSFSVSELIGGGLTGAAVGAAAGALVKTVENATPASSYEVDGFDDFRARIANKQEAMPRLAAAPAAHVSTAQPQAIISSTRTAVLKIPGHPSLKAVSDLVVADFWL